jgi:hypothetical protein
MPPVRSCTVTPLASTRSRTKGVPVLGIASEPRHGDVRKHHWVAAHVGSRREGGGTVRQALSAYPQPPAAYRKVVSEVEEPDYLLGTQSGMRWSLFP